MYATDATAAESKPEDELQATDSQQLNSCLKDVKVPLCGDLLGRERITGARKTRLGCDLGTERFESLVGERCLVALQAIFPTGILMLF